MEHGMRTVIFSFGFSLLASFASHDVFAAPKIVNTNPLTAAIAVNNVPKNIDDHSEVVITLELAPKHHAYLDQFKLKLVGAKEFSIGDFDIAPVTSFFDNFSKKQRQGIENKAVMKAILTRTDFSSDPDRELVLDLTYQACTKEYCLFPKTIQVIAQLPKPEPRVQMGLWESLKNFDPKTQHWSTSFLIVFLAGLLTAFTPCVFPMIPITLAVIGAKAPGRRHRDGFLISFVYVCGIALTYSLLGLFAATTGGLFGALLGHPLMALALALIFFVVALSSFGLFEIQSEQFMQKFLTSRTQAGRFSSVFAAGLFAGLIASPCIGPVLLGILTYVAKTQDKFLGFTLLTAYAFGLGAIFIVFGTFSNMLRFLPRSGPWMKFVKVVFGLFFIGLSIFYLRPALPALANYFGVEHKKEASSSKIQWVEYSVEALAEAKKNKKPVIFDVYADWCVSCKELDEFVFQTPTVLEATKNFVWMKFDATNSSDASKALQDKYNILGLPNVIFYDANGEWRKELTITGMVSVEEFMQKIEKLR